MSTMHRLKREPHNRCAADLWAQTFLRLTDCNVRQVVAADAIAPAAQRAVQTGRTHAAASSALVRASCSASRTAPHYNRAPCSAHLLLRDEINCNGQNQKADGQFDHGVPQRRMKRV